MHLGSAPCRSISPVSAVARSESGGVCSPVSSSSLTSKSPVSACNASPVALSWSGSLSGSLSASSRTAVAVKLDAGVSVLSVWVWTVRKSPVLASDDGGRR